MMQKSGVKGAIFAQSRENRFFANLLHKNDFSSLCWKTLVCVVPLQRKSKKRLVKLNLLHTSSGLEART